MKHLLRYGLLVVAIILVAGCGSTKEGEDRTPRRVRDLDGELNEMRARLAPPSPAVRTIQFYRDDDERLLPILSLQSRQQLTIEFDLLEESGRPLTAYFYHADRTWRRDLTPGEYLKTFQRADLLNYTISRATEVPYVHYRFKFPREDLSFSLSGNFIVRITEQGFEEDVILERAFFVTEQATSVELGFDAFTTAGQGFQTVTPIALFSPAAGTESNIFDYAVCFVLNGQLDRARCSTEPSLMQQPSLQFYLQPGASFTPTSADYFLDISNLRVGGRIERTDLTTSPFVVVLEPDYARFGGSGIDPLLNGQSVVRSAVTSVSQPEVAAEYVTTRFSFVPPNEQRVRGDIHIIGSFNGWEPRPENRMTFVAERGQYEGELLLKQGQYEYRYWPTDAATRRSIDRGIPRTQNLYTAFVYYNDIRINSDRLLAVNAQVRP